MRVLDKDFEIEIEEPLDSMELESSERGTWEAYLDEEMEEEAEQERRSARFVGKKADRDQRLRATVADATGVDGGFQTTYKPSRHEEGWLLQSLHPFYELQYITDVLDVVKGGKEANVYRCRAHENVGGGLLAAKVYRPRQFRQLRNVAQYQTGRGILTAEGRPIHPTDHRLLRAVGKRTAFGEQVRHTSWLMHEYTTMMRLYAAGVAVPKPIAAAENAVLMQYLGDERLAAPPLSEVKLETRDAVPLFQEVLKSIALLLEQGQVHGDLSAFNLLYWEGVAWLIDFPQVVDCKGNDQARDILERDVLRVCEYFQRQGVRCYPPAVSRDLWNYHAPSDSAVPQPG
jgi:RIO kinase 1